MTKVNIVLKCFPLIKTTKLNIQTDQPTNEPTDRDYIVWAYEIALRVLTNMEGAQNLYNYAEEIAKDIWGYFKENNIEPETILGVGYPFYFVNGLSGSGGYVWEPFPSSIEEFLNYNTKMLSNALSFLNGEDNLECLHCDCRDEICSNKKRGFSFKGLFAALIDTDLFAVVDDEHITPQFLDSFGKYLSERGYRTWDTNRAKVLQSLAKGELTACADIHIIPLSKYKKAIEAIRNGVMTDSIILIEEYEVYSWRGGYSWDKGHKIRLVFDLLYSALPLSSQQLKLECLGDLEPEKLIEWIFTNMKNALNSKEHRMYNDNDLKEIFIRFMEFKLAFLSLLK